MDMILVFSKHRKSPLIVTPLKLCTLPFSKIDYTPQCPKSTYPQIYVPLCSGSMFILAEIRAATSSLRSGLDRTDFFLTGFLTLPHCTPPPSPKYVHRKNMQEPVPSPINYVHTYKWGFMVCFEKKVSICKSCQNPRKLPPPPLKKKSSGSQNLMIWTMYMLNLSLFSSPSFIWARHSFHFNTVIRCWIKDSDVLGASQR